MEIMRIHKAGNPDVGCLEHIEAFASSIKKSLLARAVDEYQRYALPSHRPRCRTDMLKKGGL